MKQFKHEASGLFIEEVYADVKPQWIPAPFEVTGVPEDDAPIKRELVLTKIKLTNDFSKARRIKNLEICELLEKSGFQSIEILGKVSLAYDVDTRKVDVRGECDE